MFRRRLRRQRRWNRSKFVFSALILSFLFTACGESRTLSLIDPTQTPAPSATSVVVQPTIQVDAKVALEKELTTLGWKINTTSYGGVPTDPTSYDVYYKDATLSVKYDTARLPKSATLKFELANDMGQDYPEVMGQTSALLVKYVLPDLNIDEFNRIFQDSKSGATVTTASGTVYMDAKDLASITFKLERTK